MTPHALVVGAGVAGLSGALALLQRGHRVTVLERGTVGGESSWAGGGILAPLLPWDYPEPVSALALRSMAAYADWVDEIETASGLKAEFWRCGMRVLGVADPEQARAWCAAHGVAAEQDGPAMPHQALHIPNETLNNPISGIANEATQSTTHAASTDAGSLRSCGLYALQGARDEGIKQRILEESHIWLPGIAQVRNPRLVAALRAAVVQLGGTIHERRPVTGVLSRGDRVTAVQTAAGPLPADRMVLATGAWSGTGLADLAAVPNIRPIRGQMLLFKLAPGALSSILYRNGLYLIPRRDGHVLAGSTLEDAGFDKATDDATRRRLHLDAAALLPALADIQPIQHWAGLRPGAPDNIPVIDRHPDFDNVFVNTGHFRYGVTMAPASAELLVSLMEGTPPALDLAPYRWQAAQARRW